jgi:hypothetical protein
VPRGEAWTSGVLAVIDCTVTPASALRDVRGAGAWSEANPWFVESGATEVPEPSPLRSDVLTDFLPGRGLPLVHAIDRFLAEVESLGGELTGWQSPTSLLPAVTAVSVAVLASEVVRRRSRGGETEATDEEGDEDFAGVHRFPAAWSSTET